MAKRPSITTWLKAFNDEHVKFYNAETDLLISLDEQGLITRVNPAFEATLGYAEANILQQEIIRFVNEDDLLKFVRAFIVRERSPFRMLKRTSGEIEIKMLWVDYERTDDGVRCYLILRPQ